MNAVVFDEYGSPDVLRLAQVDKPTPKDDEVLIKVHATTVRFGDLMVRNLKAVSPAAFTMPLPLWLPVRMMFGWRKPRNRILGSEFSGEIEAVGSHVTLLKAGQAVFGYRGPRMGAHAEYLCMPEDGLVTNKPANLTFEEAATVPYGAVTALGVLRKVHIRPGDKVLINGASGAIGSSALQICKHHFGAIVTGVCGTPRVEMVEALGADHVIDYTEQAFTDIGETWDVILDVLGKSSFSRCRRSLAPDGRYLPASFKTTSVMRMLWTGMRGGRRVICSLAAGTRDDLLFARELAEAGRIKAVIDRCYPLAQTADAHRYVESGRKRGDVIVSRSKSAIPERSHRSQPSDGGPGLQQYRHAGTLGRVKRKSATTALVSHQRRQPASEHPHRHLRAHRHERGGVGGRARVRQPAGPG